MRYLLLLLLSLVPLCTSASRAWAVEPPAAVAPKVFEGTLDPLEPGRAPVLKQVVQAEFETTQGLLVLDIYPEAAPRAAERFIELVKAGYFDDTPIFRVEPGFVAQFGINSKMAEWKTRTFKDEPSLFKLGAGTIAFAKAGPDTNSTQVFINYDDNSGLVQQGGFTAFAKVSQGFENTLNFKEVMEAGDQTALWQDTSGFLKTLSEKPDVILKARILP